GAGRRCAQEKRGDVAAKRVAQSSGRIGRRAGVKTVKEEPTALVTVADEVLSHDAQVPTKLGGVVSENPRHRGLNRAHHERTQPARVPIRTHGPQVCPDWSDRI